MGTAVQYMALKSPCPILVVKDLKARKQKADGGYDCAICIDGSKKSIDSLHLLCKMKHPKDKIHVIICEQANIDTAKVKDTVSYHLEESGNLPVSHICVLKSNPGQKTKDIIRDHLISEGSEDVDFVVVGNKGADFSSRDVNDYIGSVANEVLRHTKLNCLFYI